MTREELYESWAPPAAPWSQWVKPALFATLSIPHDALAATRRDVVADVHWAPPTSERCAVVVDLPGADAVHAGLALAQRGYQPVPLFNTTVGRRPVVEVDAVVLALAEGAASLARRVLSPDAPPAFLLDDRRRRGERSPRPGDYDNRWVVFPQDLPSATFLKAQGIQRVLLAAARELPADDLAHVLRRWQDAGLAIWYDSPLDQRTPMQITVAKPPWYRSLWHRVMVLTGLRRSSAGGFGAAVPEHSTASYG